MFKGGWTVDLWSGITIKETGTASGDLMLGSYSRDILFGEFGNDTLMGFDGNDILSSAADADVVYGGNGTDLIYGGGGADLLSGDAGDDTIYGDGGNDTINGGDGNDTLDGGINNDIMTGGLGNDIYVVDSTLDQVIENAGEGVDTIQTSMSFALGGAIENLTLTGTANINGTGDSGDNVITGNAGNNVLNGLGGNDTIAGGAGNDRVSITAGLSTGVVDGNAGTDTLVLNLTSAQITPDVRADLQGFAAWMANNLAAVSGDTAALAAQATGTSFTFNALGLTVSTVEGVTIMVDGQERPLADFLNTAPTIETTAISGNEDQAITGTIAASDAEGNALTFSVVDGPANGSLTLDAATGSYSYQGAGNWSGNDQFTVTADDGQGGVTTQTVGVTVNAVADAPTLAVAISARSDTGRIITGTTRSDSITGGSGADTINGGSGDDIITGDPEDNYVMGIAISGSLTDTDGSEQLHFTIANLPSDAVLSAGQQNSDGSWTLTTDELTNLTLTTADASPFQMTVTATSTEGTNASTATTSIVIDPTVGLGETAYGNKGADIINAGNGNDLVYGNSGNDTIHGDSGNDKLYGGTGNDQVFGDTGNDTLYGGKGDDALDGGSGDDVLHGNTGNDVVSGGLGNDIVWGDEGNDTLRDGAGNDKVIGGSGNDRVVVGTGSDALDGGGDYDTLDFSELTAGVSVNAVSGLAAGAAGGDTFTGFECVRWHAVQRRVHRWRGQRTLPGWGGQRSAHRWRGRRHFCLGGTRRFLVVWCAGGPRSCHGLQCGY